LCGAGKPFRICILKIIAVRISSIISAIFKFKGDMLREYNYLLAMHYEINVSKSFNCFFIRAEFTM